MKKALAQCAFSVFLLVGLAQTSNAATMTFNGLASGTPTTPVTHTENGLTMAASSMAALPIPGNFAHFDIYPNLLGGSNADNVAAIHTGNLGEQVTFTYSGGPFDLLSIDVTGWYQAPIDPTTGTPATFQSSSGTVHTIAKGFTGVIDFVALGGWSNIVSFTLSMPIIGGNSFGCQSDSSGNSTNCTTVAFDDVTFQATAVPIPAALPLFAAGLGMMGFVSWRRKSKAARVS